MPSSPRDQRHYEPRSPRATARTTKEDRDYRNEVINLYHDFGEYWTILKVHDEFQAEIRGDWHPPMCLSALTIDELRHKLTTEGTPPPSPNEH